MDIEITERGNSRILHISGEVDMYSSPILRDKIMSLIKKKIPIILIDLKEVSYMDSSGIATFVEGLKSLRAYNGRMKFYNIPREIMEIFRFARLDNIFEIYKSFEDAISK